MSNTKAEGPHGPGAAADECADCSRRQFFSKLGVGSLVVAAAGTGLFAYEYFSPNVLFEAPPIVKAGKPNQFAPNTGTLESQSGVYLVNMTRRCYPRATIRTDP